MALSRLLFKLNYQWFLLIILFFIWNTFVFYHTNQSFNLQSYSLLLWLGIFLSIEDDLALLNPTSNKFLRIGSFTFILISLVRSIYILSSNDFFVYFFLPILIFFISLMNKGLKNLYKLKNIIIISSFLPIYKLFDFLMAPFLKLVVSKISVLILNLIPRIQFTSIGNQLFFGNKIIEISDGCSGSEQILFTITVTIIYLLIYPILEKKNIFLVLTYSFITGFIINLVRIIILSLITIFTTDKSIILNLLFDFFHNSYGSFVFILFSIGLSSELYFKLLTKELKG